MNLLIGPLRDRVLRLGGSVISVSASKELTSNKTLQTDGRTHRLLAPFRDQFGAATLCSSQNFRSRKQIAAVAAPNRFRNRSGCIFPIGTRIGRFPKLSLNQHPAGSHSKVVLCCSQAQKNMRGAKKLSSRRRRAYGECQNLPRDLGFESVRVFRCGCSAADIEPKRRANLFFLLQKWSVRAQSCSKWCSDFAWIHFSCSKILHLC